MTQSRPAPVVLTVDDEADVRRIIRRILERAGYSVLEASSGVEALDLLTSDAHLDLLIADVAMPGLAGEELARKILAARPDQKVLYVTGHAEQLFDARGTLWEGEAFLEKPFTTSGLIEAVSLLLYGTTEGPALETAGAKARPS